MISQRERGELARFYTVTDPKKHPKGYTVYKVTARIISRKNPEDVQEITAKVFGRFDESVIEERRQCSEDLLQFSANIPALYSSQHIVDFFKGGEVHDSSELIGPAEPFSTFLADSLSDCSSEVHKDIGGVDDLTTTSQSEYGGLSSDSDLISLRVDGDSLADLDDGMASNSESPNRLTGSRTPSPQARTLDLAASRAALFGGVLKPRMGKKDYLERASEQIKLAVLREEEQDYEAAFCFYRIGVDLLLQGVQGEPSPTRREAVKRKTAEYLMRAEQISKQYLKDVKEKGPMELGQTPGWQGSGPSSSHTGLGMELETFRVLGVIDKVMLVLDKRTQETFILKGLRKSSECSRNKKTIVPHRVPNMVHLHKYIISEDSIFLLLQYAEGGKLWSHVSKFLNKSREESFDIPFIQKTHTKAVHEAEQMEPQESGTSCSSSSLESSALLALPLKTSLTPSSQDDSSTQDEEADTGPCGPPPDSGGTSSEEECTDSYLTLCNEYEQEKVEPHPLGDEGPLRQVAPEVTPSPRYQSLLSDDSLGSAIAAQELSFFTEAELHLEPAEVFSPAQVASPDSLGESKRTPMEFFRIDSKESVTEFFCPEASCEKPKTKPAAELLLTAAAELVLEPDDGGDLLDPSGLDSDTMSYESVPVISFKEAMVAEDEGRPPDLLVNLPGIVADTLLSEELVGEALMSTAKASPKLGRPDVLQLHRAVVEKDITPALSALDDKDHIPAPTGAADLEDELVPEVFGISVQSDHCLTSGSEAALVHKLPSFSSPSASNVSLRGDTLPNSGEFSAKPESLLGSSTKADLLAFQLTPHCEGVENTTRTMAEENKMERDISQLFKDLDRRMLIAAQAHIPEECVRRWAVEIILALDALHHEGIICRDLNPNNILLDDRGHIQLTYFCSWSEVEDSCDREAIAGMFCAPEVGSICEETAACDWWSLGAILFELLTGKSLRLCHPTGISRHTSLNLPEFLSEEAKSLLRQLLQFNALERLGAGVAGVEDIKTHPFFAQVNWPK
ncbi:hypothetical protein GJAV_G00115700 [Gymnothorax javanicus]|nr:hypothetical protein GJAV_G00115700 [Gymnothorax javanicus]